MSNLVTQIDQGAPGTHLVTAPDFRQRAIVLLTHIDRKLAQLEARLLAYGQEGRDA